MRRVFLLSEHLVLALLALLALASTASAQLDGDRDRTEFVERMRVNSRPGPVPREVAEFRLGMSRQSARALCNQGQREDYWGQDSANPRFASCHRAPRSPGFSVTGVGLFFTSNRLSKILVFTEMFSLTTGESPQQVFEDIRQAISRRYGDFDRSFATPSERCSIRESCLEAPRFECGLCEARSLYALRRFIVDARGDMYEIQLGVTLSNVSPDRFADGLVVPYSTRTPVILLTYISPQHVEEAPSL